MIKMYRRRRDSTVSDDDENNADCMYSGRRPKTKEDLKSSATEVGDELCATTS